MSPRISLLVLSALSALVAASNAPAQTWPDKPIKFVMSAPAGSSIDVLGRTIADKLKDRLGQPVVVENKPAAGGTVAVGETAKAAPDGYTMVLAFNGPLSIAPLLQKLPYDVAKELAPVITTTSQPNVLAVNAQLPIKNVGELVAYAKANPGKLNYASVGPGSSSHLNGELLKSLAGIDIVHIPFNGSPPAVTSTVQGETQMIFAVMQPLQPQVQSGRLRALAVTSAKRFPLLPDLPTDRRERLSEIRIAGLERRARARRNAEARDRAAQRRDQRDPQAARCRAEIERRGLRPDRRLARGVRRPHQGRIRQMGAGDQKRRRQDRLNATPGPPRANAVLPHRCRTAEAAANSRKD